MTPATSSLRRRSSSALPSPASAAYRSGLAAVDSVISSAVSWADLREREKMALRERSLQARTAGCAGC